MHIKLGGGGEGNTCVSGVESWCVLGGWQERSESPTAPHTHLDCPPIPPRSLPSPPAAAP